MSLIVDGVEYWSKSDVELQINRLMDKLEQHNTVLIDILAASAALRKLVDDCAPYLNDGEDPAACIKRLLTYTQNDS